MLNKVVATSNVMRLSEACTALLNRNQGQPGMGLCYGPSGLGKSTAIAWLATGKNGVFVRALRTTTPTSLLDSIAKELNIAVGQRVASKVEAIVERLVITQRPLFIDEADYVVGSRGENAVIDTIRDVHDLSDVPVILIGMAGIDRRIGLSPQLAGRMAQWVEFKPATTLDARKLASELVQVNVADDLVEEIRTQAGGSVRNIVVGLSKVESFAKKHNRKDVELGDWPRGERFFLGGGLHAKAGA